MTSGARSRKVGRSPDGPRSYALDEYPLIIGNINAISYIHKGIAVAAGPKHPSGVLSLLAPRASPSFSRQKGARFLSTSVVVNQIVLPVTACIYYTYTGCGVGIDFIEISNTHGIGYEEKQYINMNKFVIKCRFRISRWEMTSLKWWLFSRVHKFGVSSFQS